MASLIGILGYPLTHSISPVFQQAALDHLGLDARYLAWETEPSKLGERVDSLRVDGVLGANVTIPHKEVVLQLLDEIDPTAQAIGSVNTIVNEGGRLKGHNTDAPGFLRGLREHGAFDPKGKKALVLGAGGSGRGVVFALAQAGIETVTLVNRTLSRAEGLARAVKSRFPDVAIEAHQQAPHLMEYDLLVNCTSIGMKHTPMEGDTPVELKGIRAGALVCDLVYNPQETALLKLAKEAGARALGGLPMLIFQGAIAFDLWFERKAPVEVMFEAARKALR